MAAPKEATPLMNASFMDEQKPKSRHVWSQYGEAVLPAAVRPYVPFVLLVVLALHSLGLNFPKMSQQAHPNGVLGADDLARKIPTFDVKGRDGFRFAIKKGHSNYANCDGHYRIAVGDDTEINGKPYYVNLDKGRLLAYNGKVWEITAMHYLEELKQHHRMHGFYPGSFGGFHQGGGPSPVGDWDGYTVSPLGSTDVPVAFRIAGKVTHVQVAGEYSGGGRSNARPLYKDSSGQTLGWDGKIWMIKGLHDWKIRGCDRSWPDECNWGDLEVAEMANAPATPQGPRAPFGGSGSQFSHKSFSFKLKGDGVNTGNCDGTYSLGEGVENRIHGQPFYLNKEKQRLLAYTGTNWQIVALGALPQLLSKDGTAPLPRVFHQGGAAAPDEGSWPSYLVTGDVPKSYQFKARPDGNNYANCDGQYTLADSDDAMINGKPYYVNAEKERFLAWNGKSWEITAMSFLPGVLKHHSEHGFWPGSFGGYHAGGGDWPTDDMWDDYFVSDDEPLILDRRRGFRFTQKFAGDDYGDCTGVYKLVVGANSEINGKPYYVHVTKPRFLAWNGQTWELTALEYLEGIKQHLLNHGFWPGTFGGYHYGGGNRPDEDSWPDYTVAAETPKSYVFSPLPSSLNYAKCDGTYVVVGGEDGELNGKPYFINPERRRFLAWTGVVWEITATDYLAGIKQHHSSKGYWPGSFGGYHSGGGELPDEGKWSDYAVEARYET